MNTEYFRDRYNEVVNEERDTIYDFLLNQADIRYGNQMYEWDLGGVELLSYLGNPIEISSMRVDKNAFVKFISKDCEEFECSDFAYGELIKIIERLPYAIELKAKDATDDVVRYSKEYRMDGLDGLLYEYPFKWKDGGSTFEIVNVLNSNDVKDANPLQFEVRETVGDCSGYGIWNELSSTVMISFRDHITKSVNRCSNEYKELKRLVKEPYNFVEHGEVGALCIYPFGTDLSLPVLDVAFENGELNVLVDVLDTRIETPRIDGTMNLDETMLTVENIRSIVEFFKKNKDIMSDYGHDIELVRKINDAWNDDVYRKYIGMILHTILIRDHEDFENKYYSIEDYSDEWALEHASDILMMCSDKDLEAILIFIRYEEHNI